VGVLLDATPFYPEAGGQVADSGVLELPGGGMMEVVDVQAYAGFALHVGTISKGSVKVGDEVTCKVDYERRRKIAPNHSMTHVLNFALKKVLGDDVAQKGSLVDESKLRFDFSYKGALSQEQLVNVEDICREQIAQKLPVDAEVIPLDTAMSINGLRAVFGEKYPDPVRVLSIGNSVAEMVKAPESDAWAGASLELCGGTHVGNTEEAKAFTLVQEEAVAKGVRRITAFTGEAALKTIKDAEKLETRFVATEKLPAAELEGVLTELRKEVDAAEISSGLKAGLRVRLDALVKKYMAEKKARESQFVNEAIETGKAKVEALVKEGTKGVVLELDIGTDGKVLKSVVQGLSKQCPTTPLMVISSEGGKGVVLTSVPNDMQDKLSANDWLKAALDAVGGKGGGRKDSAQGQIADTANLAEAMEAAKKFAESKL